MTTNKPWVEKSWIEQLGETPLSERTALVKDLVVTEFKTSLLMDEKDTLPFDESYFELGLTSLGATEVKQCLERSLGRPFDSASLFNNPTIGHLLNYLRTEVLAEFFVRESGVCDTSVPSDRDAVPTSETFEAQRSSPQDLVNDMLRELYQA
ncbi:MAG: acyl carrier protein [Pseudonocardiaceae bacterium]